MGEPLKYVFILTFKATDNEVEYEALITDLRLAKGLDMTSLKVNCETQLVVNLVVKDDYA